MSEVLRPRRGVYAPLFAMWIAMASIVMMFGAMTSSFIVRRAAGNWLEFKIPDIFFISTIVILVSSVTLHLSYWGFRNQKEYLYKIGLPATLGLGILFIILQYYGWMDLYNIGIPLDGNPSGSFFYLISGLHAAHVVGGIFAIAVATIHAYMLTYKPTEMRRRRFQIVLHYWHFVDFLWLYLFIFLMIQ
jgi:cytochrome c oxidase subunit 3